MGMEAPMAQGSGNSAIYSGNTCPVCANANGSGQSISNGDGSNFCGNCGSTWRNVSNFSPNEFPSANQSKANFAAFNPPGIMLGIFSVLAVFSAFYLTSTPADRRIETPVEHPLIIADVSVESFTNSNGNIWVISGVVKNKSPNRLVVPPLLMQSGQKGSSGYFMRKFNPALQKLAPGSSFKFRSAIRKPAGDTRSLTLRFGGA